MEPARIRSDIRRSRLAGRCPDGRSREIVAKRPQGSEIAWGQLVLSKDGSKLLSSPFQGDIIIVDLASGAMSKVIRAKQVQVGGRCGGSVGVLTAWLDANTVIWHESFAEKGGNGITISRTDGTNRRLIPFFTVSDIRTVAPNLVTFTTGESTDNKTAFQVSWLLDTTTGEARPVTVGVPQRRCRDVEVRPRTPLAREPTRIRTLSRGNGRRAARHQKGRQQH